MNIILSYNANKTGVASYSLMDSCLKLDIALFDNLEFTSFRIIVYSLTYKSNFIIFFKAYIQDSV